MQEYYDEIRQYNAKVLSISVKSPDVAKIIVDTFQLEYPILCDVQKEVIPQYCVLNLSGTNVIPSVFIIDMWGIIRWKHVDDGTGIVSGTTIIEKLQEVPLAVTFASLTAFSVNDSVTIKWSTATEIGNLGFNIYRSETAEGKYIKVNSNLIQSAWTSINPVSYDYSYTDDSLKFGETYYYYIEDIDFSGKKDKSPLFRITVGQKSDVEVIPRPSITIRPKLNPIPTEFALLQNYPNPFNPETWIPFQLSQDMSVTIKIYDTKGQLVRTIALGHRQAGIYLTKDRAVYWNGKDSFGEKVGSGVYFYTLQSNEANFSAPVSQFQVSRKMVMLK